MTVRVFSAVVAAASLAQFDCYPPAFRNQAGVYQVDAVRFATEPSYPTRFLVAGADSARRTPLAFTLWLIQGGDRIILMDAGFYRQKFIDRWKPENYARPSAVLEANGIKPERVTDIVISHIHWDHLDGADLFPRARIWLQRAEFEHYTNDSGAVLDRAIDPDDAKMLASLRAAGRVRLIDGDSVGIMPGITVFTGGKHTFASQYATVRDHSRGRPYGHDRARERQRVPLREPRATSADHAIARHALESARTGPHAPSRVGAAAHRSRARRGSLRALPEARKRRGAHRMKIQFLLVPYDSGRREWRMGRGPSYLLRHGVGSSIRALGHEVDAEYVEPGGVQAPNPPASTEITTSFSLYREVADRARTARENGALPIVLGGNCGVTLGAVASLVPRRRILSVGDGEDSYPELEDVGVLWLDAHGDFNTPETTRSGFLDGMSLAMLTGRCWYTLGRGIPGFRPMAERHVLLAGVRDLDPAEDDLVRESELLVARAQEPRPTRLAQRISDALGELRGRVRRLHVHLDADVVDDSAGRANAFAVPFGLTSDELREVARLAASQFEVVSAAVTSYDPAIDTAGALPPIIVAALEALLTR